MQAQQTYLQEHLNVAGYLSSTECALADDLTMAFSANDLEKLDKAKRSTAMHALDFEVQALCKSLSLFDACFTDDVSTVQKLPPLPTLTAPATSTTAGSAGGDSSKGKSDLFAKPAPKNTASAASPAHNKPPPPPPAPVPTAAADELNDFGEYEGSDSGEPADLGDVDIPDDTSDAAEETNDFETAPIEVKVEQEPAQADEDEDEIDLS